MIEMMRHVLVTFLIYGNYVICLKSMPLNFHVIIQVIFDMHTKSIQKQIVEYDIKIKYPEEYLTVDTGGSEKP